MYTYPDRLNDSRARWVALASVATGHITMVSHLVKYLRGITLSILVNFPFLLFSLFALSTPATHGPVELPRSSSHSPVLQYDLR